MTILKYIFIKKRENISKRVTSKHVTENVKERPALPSLKRVRSHPLSPCTAKPPRRGGGGVAEKNHNLKAARVKNFCKTQI